MDILLHPVERRALIQKTCVWCSSISGLIRAGKESKRAQLLQLLSRISVVEKLLRSLDSSWTYTLYHRRSHGRIQPGHTV